MLCGVFRRHPVLVIGVVTAALVMVAHARSLTIGLFFDDHQHYQHLRDGDWSYESAVNAARLTFLSEHMEVWSRPAVELRFYRPVAFWLMRAEYVLFRWQPLGLHAMSLVWHWLCAMLVAQLAWRVIGTRLGAGVAAGIIAMHPGHVITVEWIACQTELFVTALLLGATLAYARYAGWWRPGVAVVPPADEVPTTNAHAPGGGRGTGESTTGSAVAAAATEPDALACSRARYVWLTAAALLFTAAMGCRENAVVWPAVMITGDALFRAPWRRRVIAYAIFACLVVAYLAARHAALGGFPVPPLPYLMRPSDPGFARFVIDKFAYYALAVFAAFPIFPTAFGGFFDAHPALLYGTFAGIVTLILLLIAVRRTRRVAAFAAAWTAVFFLPVLPLLALSYHIYLPSIGAALLFTAALALIDGKGTSWRRAVSTVCVILVAMPVGLFTWWMSLGFCSATHVEDEVVQDVLATGPPLRDNDNLFFVNLPALAYYAAPAIEYETGLHGLRGHVLTFSPWLLAMQDMGTVKRLDDRTLEVTAPTGTPYFGGTSGRILLAIMGISRIPETNETIHGPAYDVHILEADAQGIRRLRFDFHAPIDSAGYHVYLGSPVRWAYPLPGEAD